MGVRKNLLIKQRYLVKCKKENLFELDTKSILHHGRVVITCTPRQGRVLLAVSWLYNEQICMGTCVGSSLQEAVVKAELEWQEMSWWRCLRKTKGRRSRSRHEKLSMPNVGLMPVKKGERGLDKKSPDWYHLRHSQPAQQEVTKQKLPFAWVSCWAGMAST